MVTKEYKDGSQRASPGEGGGPGGHDDPLFRDLRLEYDWPMIPFDDLIAALERYKRRRELEAAAGTNAAPTPAPKQNSGKGKATISADDYGEEL